MTPPRAPRTGRTRGDAMNRQPRRNGGGSEEERGELRDQGPARWGGTGRISGGVRQAGWQGNERGRRRVPCRGENHLGGRDPRPARRHLPAPLGAAGTASGGIEVRARDGAAIGTALAAVDRLDRRRQRAPSVRTGAAERSPAHQGEGEEHTDDAREHDGAETKVRCPVAQPPGSQCRDLRDAHRTRRRQKVSLSLQRHCGTVRAAPPPGVR